MAKYGIFYDLNPHSRDAMHYIVDVQSGLRFKNRAPTNINAIKTR